MREKIDRFLQLSEVYLVQDINSKQHITKIMLAQGVLIQMESDLILFEKSKGKTEKGIEQAERIKILRTAIDTFSVVSSNNYQIGHILNSYNKISQAQGIKIAQLEAEIVSLKKQQDF